MSSPVTAKQMRLSISANGLVYTLAAVEMVDFQILREGGVEHRYGLRGIQSDNRHKVGMKRAKFTIRRFFKTDPNQGKVFYDLHDNDTEFILKEYVKDSDGFIGLRLNGCMSYNYRLVTGTANDIVGEEISGEAADTVMPSVTLWEKINSEWLDGWSYRKCHDINSATGAGTDYQIKIIVHYGSGTDSGGDVYCNSKCKTDFGDIRFVDNDKVTELDYWMETGSKIDGDKAIFWVEISDDLSSNPVTIYLYYGNSSATTTSNGDNTFLFFDDFLGTSLDTTKWDIVGAGGGTLEITIANSIAYLKDTVMNYGCIRSKNTYGPNVSMVSREHVGTNFYQSVWGSYHGFVTGYVGGAVYRVMMFYGYNLPYTVLHTAKGAGAKKETTVTTPSAYTQIDLQWTTISILLENDIQKATHSDVYTPQSGALSNELGVYALDWYIDWTLIRKFVSPEPAHSSWCEEATQ